MFTNNCAKSRNTPSQLPSRGQKCFHKEGNQTENHKINSTQQVGNQPANKHLSAETDVEQSISEQTTLGILKQMDSSRPSLTAKNKITKQQTRDRQNHGTEALRWMMNPGFCSNMLFVGWEIGINNMNPWLHWEHVWRVQADRDGEIVWGITDTRVNTTANLEIVSDKKWKKKSSVLALLLYYYLWEGDYF